MHGHDIVQGVSVFLPLDLCLASKWTAVRETAATGVELPCGDEWTLRQAALSPSPLLGVSERARNHPHGAPSGGGLFSGG